MKIKAIIIVLMASMVYSFAQEPGKKDIHIGMLLDVRTSEIEPLTDRLKNEIRAIVGEDANIVFSEDQVLVNDFDLDKAEEHYQMMVKGKSDIILAFGAINNVIVSRKTEHLKPTILFGSAPGDFAELDKTKTSSGIHNLVYLVTSQSFEVDLEVFSELYPYENVGIAVEAAMERTLPVKELLDRIFQSKQAKYRLIPFENINDITSDLEGLDALYMGGGFLLTDSEVSGLVTVLNQKRIPSFTSTDVNDVTLGLMATNQRAETLDQFFRRIALSVEAIINGEDAANLPLYIESNSELTINYNTAERLGVPLKYSLIATTNLVGDFENVTAEKRYNLLEVMKEVLTANLTLRSGAKDIELTGQDVKTAKSNYLPEVTGSVTSTYLDPKIAEISNGQNPEYSTDGSVTISQTIFAPGATANIKIQEDLLNAQRETYNASQLDVIFDGANAYFNALLLKANLQISSRNLDLTKRNLQLAQQNYESGQSGKSDLLQFRSQMAQNTQTLVEAVNQLEQGFFSLNQLLNQPINRKIDVQDADLGKGVFEEYDYDQLRVFLDDPSLRAPFVEFLVGQARNNAPELKSLAYNISANERNLQLAKRGRFLPTIALQGQYNSNFTQGGVGTEVPMGFAATPKSNYNVGLNLSLPIFQRNQQNINRQTASIQKEQLDINRQNIELNLENNVNVAVLQLTNQIANIELSKVSEEAAREGLELTQESYATGAVNWVQLTEAQDNYLNAQLANANAIYNYLLSSLQLERIMGYYFLLHTSEENENFRQEFFTYLTTRN
ncbi:TolC family protein [Roseivirga sp. E12]|uniref:TolC family protein n=1 Tax=Roseivirga sp. E12 TaxID=2819237 RepID=UPI001ABC5A7A|nr:TolC family protein [Roseivirga sp. E12]MBO3697820.1 TolC family protein [Roseivirga sp. E12]